LLLGTLVHEVVLICYIHLCIYIILYPFILNLTRVMPMCRWELRMMLMHRLLLHHQHVHLLHKHLLLYKCGVSRLHHHWHHMRHHRVQKFDLLL